MSWSVIHFEGSHFFVIMNTKWTFNVLIQHFVILVTCFHIACVSHNGYLFSIDGFSYLFFGLAGFFLQETDQLIFLAFGIGEVVVGEASVSFFESTLDRLNLSFAYFLFMTRG